MMSGTLLHLNAVGLMAALAELEEPGLRGRPFAVAREGAQRACLLDLSPRAHREGLRPGMLLREARRLLPGLELRPPRPERLEAAEAELFRIASAFSPLVERAGRGHLYVELRGTRGLWGPAPDAAAKLRREILGATGLAPVLALASGKTFAKVASRLARPCGLLVLEEGEELPLLRAQPVELLPGVGPLLLERLRLLELEDIGSLADLDEGGARALGPRGPALASRARGLGDSAVDPEPPERRRLGAAAVLEPDSADPEILGARLRLLVEELGFRLRREGLGARVLRLAATRADGSRDEFAHRAPRPLARDAELLGAALRLLSRARERRVRLRRLELGLEALEAAGPELDLFEPAAAKRDRLEAALDGLRARYGPASLSSAAALRAGLPEALAGDGPKDGGAAPAAAARARAAGAGSRGERPGGAAARRAAAAAP